MSLNNDRLLAEFPQYLHAIGQLKSTNRQFSSLVDEYHQVDDEVCHIENGPGRTDNTYLLTRKLRRIKLKRSLLVLLEKATQ